jgi:proteasome lid subunit RPN8/RPN11
VPDEKDVDAFLATCGEPIDAEALEFAKARSVAGLLQARDDVGAELVEVRKSADREWLIIRVAVDVGQAPFVDIHREEPIALGFKVEDDAWPGAVSLRPDFPDEISHVFVGLPTQPVCLCLSEAPWEDVKRRWTPMGLIRAVRTWLIDTARGALHRADQPLEPFLLGSSAMVILPADIFEAASKGRVVYGEQLGGDDLPGRRVFRFRFPDENSEGAANFVAASFIVPPRQHGFIRRAPRSLKDLTILLQADDFDFNGEVETAIKGWLEAKLTGAYAAFLLSIPVTRDPGGPVERIDTWAFVSGSTVAEVAEAYDLAGSVAGVGVGTLLASARKPGPYGESIGLDVLNPTFELTPEAAAGYNGLPAPSGRDIFAVGAGALGSQVIGHLVRMGERVTAIVDEDRLFPHNLARHAVCDQRNLGFPKATLMSALAESILPAAGLPKSFMVNVADPAPNAPEAYGEAMGSAGMILDMAASVPVSRRLAIEEPAPARRVSAFLSPNGHDLVILGEDDAREVQLDHLEMNYYAAVASDERLTGHFDLAPGVRYARSCREVSAQLPQAHIAVHSGIAADRIRRLSDEPAAFATVWRLNPTRLTVETVDVDVRPLLSFESSGWTVLVSPALLESLWEARTLKLPVETGGVLLGDFDTTRKRVYLIASIASPADSKESEGGYIRGAHGLQERVEDVESRTLGMLRYVGEWHSHPEGHPAAPSGEDLLLYGHLTDAMQVEGYPPVMLIVAEGHFGLVVDGGFREFDPGETK